MFIVSLFMILSVTIAVIALLRPVALHLGLVDVPGGRKLHQGQVPLIGGIAMFIGIFFGLLLIGRSLLFYRGLLAAMGVLVFIGVLDDLHEMSAKMKLCGQIFAAALVAMCSHVALSNFGDLFGFGAIHFDLFVLPITVFAIVGMINAVNFIDGVDGLAATVIVCQLAILIGLSWGNHQHADATFLAVILASALGFLCFNFPIANHSTRKVFMGDAGSMLLGLLLVWFAIKLTQGPQTIVQPITAVWIFAYQLMDVASCIMRRLRRGQSPFLPDKLHLHHILQRADFSPLQIVLIIAGSTLVMAAVGIALDLTHVPERLSFIFFLTLFIGYLLLLRRAPQWIRAKKL